MATYFVGVYWGPRDESHRACAGRVAAFLAALASTDSGLARWYKKVRSRKAKAVQISTAAAELEPLLKGYYKDIGGGVMSDLGFSFSAWTGAEAEIKASFAVAIGATSPAICNSAVISFNSDFEPSADLLQRVLQAAVDAFDPDEGVIKTIEELEANRNLVARDVPSGYH